MRRILCVASCWLIFTITGCMAGPNYRRPSAPVPPAWSQPPIAPPAGTWQPARPDDAVLHGDWWKLYHDPQLNALEARIAVSNQTLRAATEQYLAAREQVQAV